MARLVADCAALQAGLVLEQRQVPFVEDDLSLSDDQATGDFRSARTFSRKRIFVASRD
jgi:hypothetical protein